MHSWVKLVWEKATCLKVVIEIADPPLHPPQEMDSWSMQVQEAQMQVQVQGPLSELQQQQPVEVQLCASLKKVLFLLDIMDASGQAVDR